MQIEALDRAAASLAELDTRIRAELTDYQRPLRLLQTIPGIDFGSDCTLLVEIGPDRGAFRQARHLGAWAGVAPGNNTSAGKRRSGRARPGNATLRATLAECAHGAVRTKRSQFYDYHRASPGSTGRPRSRLWKWPHSWAKAKIRDIVQFAITPGSIWITKPGFQVRDLGPDARRSREQRLA